MKAVRQFKSQAGFSLIELMIVVAIIGILASIAVPNFQRFQRKAKQTEGKGYLAAIYTGEKSFQAEWNEYTASLKGIGFSAEGVGCYVAGFTAAAVPIAAAGVAAADPVRSQPPTAKGGCTIPAAVTGDVAPTATNFTAATAGDLGGAAQDRWTIDDAKNVLNTQIGL